MSERLSRNCIKIDQCWNCQEIDQWNCQEIVSKLSRKLIKKIVWTSKLINVEIDQEIVSKLSRNCIKMTFKLLKSWSVHNLNEGWKKPFLSKKLNVRWCYKRGDHFLTLQAPFWLNVVWNSNFGRFKINKKLCQNGFQIAEKLVCTQPEWRLKKAFFE